MPQPEKSDRQARPRLGGLRQNVAYALMANLVVFTSVGVGLIYTPAGLITFGITSGLYGYLLGAD